MAQGTFYEFYALSEALTNKSIGLADAMQVRLISEGHNAGIAPTDNDAGNVPLIGSYTEVTGTGYALKTLISQAVARVNGVTTMSASPFTVGNKWDSNPAGPANVKSAILEVIATGRCLGYWDLTSDDGVTPVSLQAGPISLNFGSGSGAIMVSQV